jgi:hypothetical protein
MLKDTTTLFNLREGGRTEARLGIVMFNILELIMEIVPNCPTFSTGVIWIRK